MAKSKEKTKAIELRKDGWSIKAIAKHLGVSRGSASAWCREITLSFAQKEFLRLRAIQAGNAGRALGTAMNIKKKTDNIAAQKQIAKKMVGKLTKRDVFMLGIGLYMGEGVKSPLPRLSCINSDPALVRLAQQWFEEYFDIKREDLNPYVYISEHHRDREKVIQRYWRSILGLDKKQEVKVVFLKGRPKKVYENHNSYYGVCALNVRRGTTIKYRVLGIIQHVKQLAGVVQGLEQGTHKP